MAPSDDRRRATRALLAVNLCSAMVVDPDAVVVADAPDPFLAWLKLNSAELATWPRWKREAFTDDETMNSKAWR
jgi:hypothetical protein